VVPGEPLRAIRVFIVRDGDGHGVDPATVAVTDRLKKEPASA
jgi:hypothetical protein